MKNKSLFLILVISISLFSFTEIEVNPLIGDWVIVKHEYNKRDGTVIIDAVDECFANNIFSYTDEGLLLFTRHRTNKQTGDCEKLQENFWTGTWEYKNDTYYIEDKNTWLNGDVVDRGVDSITTYEFYDNNLKLKTHMDYDKSGVIFFPDIYSGQTAYFKRKIK